MLKSKLAELARRIEDVLMAQVPGNDPLDKAMRHALTGGKRLRGFLVIESARLHGIGQQHALYPAAAIEAMHAYSLVHDDMPCMDDDDLRRGQPTVHVKWDEAMAVLVGDALQAMAFELALDPKGAQTAQARSALGLGLAQAAGAAGMVRGQAMDIAAETAEMPLDLQQISDLQAGKTGALFHWSATAGPIMAGADVTPLARYAADLGLAFQIHDDVLDEIGDAEAVGKAVGKDAAAGKATFVSLMGLDAARARADTLITSACDALAPYGAKADLLRDLAQFIVKRDM